ncbi:MAG TPA: FkbM family methyltransferase, partial [Pyrinomonadaceae bacterium]|nr:FkbM family methyltransferase [Pyrinomonadaceae bacterium]
AEVRLFQALVQPSAVVFDIGAHIGALTIPLARFVGPTGLVVAIEPERLNYYALCANVALNNLPWVICLQNCISDQTGVIRVADLDRSLEQNFAGLELDQPQVTENGNLIPLFKLDDLDVASSLTLIKIDVEGMEQRVLQGAVRTIEQYRPFLYVENDRKEKSQDLMDFIGSLGYRMWHHQPPFWNPENFAQKKTNIFPDLVSQNLFCHPVEQTLAFDPADFQLWPV